LLASRHHEQDCARRGEQRRQQPALRAAEHRAWSSHTPEPVQFAKAGGVHSIPVPPHSGHCGKKTGRQKSAFAKGGLSSSIRYAAGQAEAVKSLMAAGIHELNALLSKSAANRSRKIVPQQQLARAIDHAARSILGEERSDFTAALKALDGLSRF